VTVYIDSPVWPGHGRLWSHLVSDLSYDELHAFAASLGIPPRAFERDHYDVIADRYEAAVLAGARRFCTRPAFAGARYPGWPLSSTSTAGTTPRFRPEWKDGLQQKGDSDGDLCSS
jgi:hypothetical protein